MEIITAVKENEAHTVMTNCLPKGTSGSDEIGSESIYFAGRQWKQRGVQRLASKAEVDWGNSEGKDGVCFCCGHPGHVAAKCIADMPQEVKDHIISGIAHVVREDKSDESADDDMTEIVTFTRDILCAFALMANALQPTCDHKDEMDIAQTFMEFAHMASHVQWEPKFMDDRNRALISIASDAWKQFRLMEHGWYIEDPTWRSTSFRRVGVLEFGLQKHGLWRMCHLMWTHPILTTKGQTT